jgi:hypothetical protein
MRPRLFGPFKVIQRVGEVGSLRAGVDRVTVSTMCLASRGRGDHRLLFPLSYRHWMRGDGCCSEGGFGYLGEAVMSPPF